jgi:hypothetical protein
MGARSHYEVLGVSARAGHAELRRAYLDRAREAHPDRHIDAGSAQRADAERRMREVNEAWRVLGNQRRRRRYDLERAPEMMFASRSDGTMPHDNQPDDAADEIDGTTRLIRGLPWMILVVVLLAIFVFTAYASNGSGPANPVPSNNLARCVAVTAGSTVTPAPCGTPGARLVVAEVDTTQQCPLGSERLQPSSGATVYCLEV